MDKGLFYITLCFCCIWLIVDAAVGSDRVGAFLKSLFPGLYD